jgi:hypothetical protein
MFRLGLRPGTGPNADEWMWLSQEKIEEESTQVWTQSLTNSREMIYSLEKQLRGELRACEPTRNGPKYGPNALPTTEKYTTYGEYS